MVELLSYSNFLFSCGKKSMILRFRDDGVNWLLVVFGFIDIIYLVCRVNLRNFY